MKKISVSNLVKFRKKLEKNQKAFLNSLIKKNEIKSTEGGNYWVRSLSALSNAVKLKDSLPIKEKIAAILEDYKPNIIKQTKDKYDRNLQILHNYEDFDFSNWIPDGAEILSKANKKSIIYIDTVPVQILPNQIYSFS